MNRYPLISLIVCLIALSGCGGSSKAAIKGQWVFGGAGDEVAYDVERVGGDSFAFCGQSRGDAYLVKVDKFGNVLWSQTYGASGNEVAVSMQVTSDGGFILVGGTDSFGSGGRDAYVIKTDAEGIEEWSITYGGSQTDLAISVSETLDGGFIIAGDVGSEDGFSDAFLLKTDSLGNEEWSNTYGGDTHIESDSSVVQLSDGGFVMGGTQISDEGSSDFYLLKTDAQGNEEWLKTYGGEDTETFSKVAATSDNGFILTGQTFSFNPINEEGDSDVFLVKTDSSGNEVWSTALGGPEFENGFDVLQTPFGQYVVAGETWSFNGGLNSDAYLVMTDSLGNEIWSQAYGGDDSDVAHAVEYTSRGFIVAGITFSFGAGNADVFVIRTDFSGNTSGPPAE